MDRYGTEWTIHETYVMIEQEGVVKFVGFR